MSCSNPNSNEKPVLFISKKSSSDAESQPAKSRRLTMVFPPMTMPTSPPLGMAMLKGYVERELPQWQVTTFDLNVWCFRFLLNGLAQGEIGLDNTMYQKMGATREILLSAAAAFNGQNDQAFYHQPEMYDKYGAVFLNFTEMFCQVLHAECDAWERDGTSSPLLDAFVNEIMKTEPEIVGISMIFSQQIPIGAMLGKYIRTKFGLKVFIGGSCLTDGAEPFMNWYPEAADVLVTGDGEGALKALLMSEGKPDGIAGTHYRKEGKVVHETSVFQKDIDAFGAPDFSTVDFSHSLLLTPACGSAAAVTRVLLA